MRTKSKLLRILLVVGGVLLIALLLFFLLWINGVVCKQEDESLTGQDGYKQVKIVCAGDNLVHLWLLSNKTDNCDSFYQHVKQEITSADYAVVNQETPFVENMEQASDYPRFGTPLIVGEALSNAGFDMMTLANNHILDRGLNGVKNTTDFCNEKGIEYIGVNLQEEEPEDVVKIVEINEIKVAMLNYTYATNGLPSPSEHPTLVERLDNKDRMEKQLIYAREHADAVLVFVHWGEEYALFPNEEQEELCEFFAEQKADVIIGTHPHVLQPYEEKVSKTGHRMHVFYSLGNFLSGQDKPERMVGGLAEFTIIKRVGDGVLIRDCNLVETVTHQENGVCATYLRSDYTEELARRHRISDLLSYLIKTPLINN